MEVLEFITPLFVSLAVGGTLVGIIFGAIPGMTATMAVAICLPLTYSLGLENGLALLLGLYVGGISGGLVPAVLLREAGLELQHRGAALAARAVHGPARRGRESHAHRHRGVAGGRSGVAGRTLFLCASPGRFRHQVFLCRKIPDHPVRPDRDGGAVEQYAARHFLGLSGHLRQPDRGL